MGGVSTSYQNYLRQDVVKVSSNSEGDEYLVTRLESVEPALNIVNIYGQIEGRAGGKENLLESWGRILKELSLIEARGEGVLILGDLNRGVGSDELGVPGNSPTVSYGGRLVRDLLASEEYCLLNGLALAEGGPWTREDSGDGGLSCLDLAICSRNMLPLVDEGGQYEGVHSAEGDNQTGKNDSETDGPLLPAGGAVAAEEGEEPEDDNCVEQEQARGLGSLQSNDRSCSE